MQKTGLIIAGDGEDAQEAVQVSDGLVFVGPADDAETALRERIGPPCTLCFGAGFIEMDEMGGPVEVMCTECGGEGVPKPREPATTFSAADFIV